ncbi:hypothetical protein EOPP23_13575 [Endozoicomonas sp. OPT23]|uniref:hypothetical protein n=1 Tax=Endozoicomonas sp. OPT23 TaxID=2072845 RepID=UPI00129A56C4|nr:hypothetical protein [Endozoicomonas sp. OPT23]MRI34021.1 hypothetical protein [Endozoicomonas sp. OPT23]
MSDDIAFRIQLGLILPKLKEKLAPSLTEIVTELVHIVNAGSLEEDSETDLGPVKEIMMKDLEIFLDKEILPVVEASLKKDEPVVEEAEPEVEEAEGSTEESSE